MTTPSVSRRSLAPDRLLPPELVTQPGADKLRGRRIAVVGAGIAGLACAYTLTGLGAIVEVYEARAAIGGRILTLRDGDTPPDSGSQLIRLPSGQSVEGGAARIHPHQVTMDWARLLGVPLAPLVVRNDDALINLTDGRVPHVLRQRDWWQDVRERTVRADIRADFPHLLADSPADREPHRTRRTLIDWTESGNPLARNAVPGEPVDLERLLSPPAAGNLLADLSTLKSAPLLQVVGGTDVLISRLSAPVAQTNRHLRHVLTGIARRGPHVDLTFSTPDGAVCEVFDSAIVTVPPHVLSQIDSDFPPEILHALRVPRPRPAVKVFLTYPQRWWERELGIFGGTSYPADPVDRLWYPSTDWTEDSGTLTAYCLKSNAEALDELDRHDRHTAVLDAIAALHPTVAAAAEPSNMQSISWSQVPHLQGAWVNWPSYEHAAYSTLAVGMGSVQLAGDWLHPLTAWMSGAFASATSAMLKLMKTVERLQE